MNENFIDRLERIINEKAGGKLTVFAKKAGISPGAAHAYTQGRIPQGEQLIRIHESFGINIHWLLTGEGEPYSFEEGPREAIDPERCLSPEDFLFVPLLEGWVAAGPAGEIIYGDIADHYPFKRWWIERLIGKRPERLKELFLIKVRGNSMSPTINQGEVILVDTNESERLTIRTGHIYVVVMPDGSIVLKRLAFPKQADSMRLICMSDNISEYKPFDFELEYGKSILTYVLGRVRWAGKEFD